MDTPEGEDTETEYVQELRNKRLGLSDTVYQQIRRYSDAAKKAQMIPYSEATGLVTLIGRRPDAEELFVSAGRILANDAYDAMSASWRNMIRIMPALLARPLALRRIRQVTSRLFGGSIERTGGFLSLSITDSVITSGGPTSTGCTYYASALREMLRLLINGGGPVDHVQCLERGDNRCEWRAEWHSLKSAAT